MRLQKDLIIKTALELLDRDGLDGLTLRRLAKELNVQAPAIYWHIPNKSALLDELANAILAERFGDFDWTDDRRDWAAWLDTMAHELRAAMLAHREGGRVVAGAHPDIAVFLLQLWDMSIRVLRGAGFGDSKAVTVTMTVIHFTFGTVIEEQASPSNPPDEGEDPTIREQVFEITSTFQALTTAMGAWVAVDDDQRFSTSIRMIINGARMELESES